MSEFDTEETKGDGSVEKIQTTIRLPAELKEILEQEASKRGYTMKDLVIIIFREYFERANSQG